MPDPEEPLDPELLDPEPEPELPEPDPEEPLDPELLDPDPEEPLDPELLDPDPDPELLDPEPVEPLDPELLEPDPDPELLVPELELSDPAGVLPAVPVDAEPDVPPVDPETFAPEPELPEPAPALVADLLDAPAPVDDPEDALFPASAPAPLPLVPVSAGDVALPAVEPWVELVSFAPDPCRAMATAAPTRTAAPTAVQTATARRRPLVSASPGLASPPDLATWPGGSATATARWMSAGWRGGGLEIPVRMVRTTSGEYPPSRGGADRVPTPGAPPDSVAHAAPPGRVAGRTYPAPSKCCCPMAAPHLVTYSAQSHALSGNYPNRLTTAKAMSEQIFHSA